MSGDTKDATIKRLNDLASRVETLEFLLQSNDITVPSMAGTDNNGEMYPPTQDPDTTFNFPGYNSQSKDGQLQQQLQQIQDLADYLQSLIAQQQLLGTGGSADFNQAGAMDAFQGTADDGANGNGIQVPSGKIPSVTLPTMYGFSVTPRQSFTSGAAEATVATTALTFPGDFDASSGALSAGIFTVVTPGYYLLNARIELADTIANTSGVLTMYKDTQSIGISSAPGMVAGIYLNVCLVKKLVAGNKIKITFFGVFGPSPYTPNGNFSATLLFAS